MRDLTPQTAKIAVRIDEVDVKNRLIVGIDKTGAKISISFRDVPAAFRIPAQGELWTAWRYGWMWFIDQRIDSADEHDALVEQMTPGDMRMQANGTIQIYGQAMTINGQPFGATALDTFSGDGATVDFTLNAPPVHGHTVQVYVESDFLHQQFDYSVSGNTVTFVTAPTNGDRISVYYQRLGRVFEDAQRASGFANISALEDYDPV